ncbi:MAG: D-alanyl-D-alanine carboxypeptidase [Oscillospiraceae bacterium]|nr:D-alanyl-D-alanine carboxypeptidase [Oscillospiraceae bacterium]MBQ9982220.1 D-alanyl-D-alanine carboxypeptidase [Oscillospiraceae bacterium]
MKKILSVLTVFIIFLSMVPADTAEAISFNPSETIYSDSAILYNLDTETIVYEKKADDIKAPAQLVQVMTAVVVLEKEKDLSKVVEVPSEIFEEFDIYREKYPEEEFPYSEVTTCYIDDGEQLTIESLLYAMLLRSSCEAASTLAYVAGDGSIQNFVSMMNKKAEEIGAVNTHFTNPHGLYDEKQTSTARDLMLITRYALDQPGFSEISSTYSFNTGATNVHESGIDLENVNLMMDPDSEHYYQGTKGIKTGNSNQSGRCLITRASRDGQNYLLVLMNSPLEMSGETKFTHLIDARKIFNWAFETITYRVVVEENNEIDTVKINYAKDRDFINLKPAEEVWSIWPNNVDTSTIDWDVKLYYEELNAPVKAGDVIGSATFKYQGNEIQTVDLVTYSDVEVSKIKYATAVIETYFKSSAFKQALKIAFGLSVIYIVVVIYVINLRAKKRREMRAAQRRNIK